MSLDELLGAVLDRIVTRAQLQEFVTAPWNAKRFAFRSEAVAAWVPKVAAMAAVAAWMAAARREGSNFIT